MFFYYYQRSACFGQFFRPSSGAYKNVCAALGIVMLSCCLPLVWLGWNSSAVYSRKAGQYKLLMMGGKTARNMQSPDNNKERFTIFISLVI
jgi:hypothetical protein